MASLGHNELRRITQGTTGKQQLVEFQQWYSQSLVKSLWPLDTILMLVQERRISSALAMELCLSCTNPSIWHHRSLSTLPNSILYWFSIMQFDLNKVQWNLDHWPLGVWDEISDKFPANISNWWLRYIPLVNIALGDYHWASVMIKSRLVQVMMWCHQGTRYYLSQCWPSSIWCH